MATRLGVIAAISSLLVFVVVVVIYNLDPFEASPFPPHEFSTDIVTAPKCNPQILEGAEFLGSGELLGPEDIAFDSNLGLIYTGCGDGWVKTLRLNDSKVDNWVFTAGRPLGIALGIHGDLLVADTHKGLLRITKDRVIEPLTNEANGLKFKLTDGVDVAKNGVVYFTDGSSKYSFDEYILDILEGKPHGRFMSYDPMTKTTQVLVSDLYFANGVAVAPTQDFVIFCETPLRRCRKYYIEGDRKGSVDKFVDNLPGTPDNIRYDGNGLYWIGFATEITSSWFLALKYPMIRKVLAMMEKNKYIGRLKMEKNGGVIAVDLQGNLIAQYYDKGLSMITAGFKIGNHLYCGSLGYSDIIRLHLHHFPAHAAACPRPFKSEL